MTDYQWSNCETCVLQRGEFTGTSLKQPADTFITMLRVRTLSQWPKLLILKTLCDDDDDDDS
jgi:hypothetical protein